LFKVLDGDCIGGYTKANWSSNNVYVSDCDAILFNLSCSRQFPSKRKTGKEIECYNDYGPCFNGGGGSELDAWKEPFNGNGKCYSFANKSSYGITLDAAGKNMLTN
jgi:hypothetical protein